MSENIIVPALGESITEATVSKWIKNQGDQVKEDEPIVELETDKVNVEVPSPAEGVISKINFKTGDTVEVVAPPVFHIDCPKGICCVLSILDVLLRSACLCLFPSP